MLCGGMCGYYASFLRLVIPPHTPSYPIAGQQSCIAWDHRGLKIPRKKNEAIFIPLQTCAYTNTRDSILILCLRIQEVGDNWRWCMWKNESAECFHPWLLSYSELSRL